MVQHVAGVVAVGAVLAVFAPEAEAQAWTPDKGEGAVTVLYQHMLVNEHLQADGSRVDRGHIGANNLIFDFTYGITERVAVTVGMPYFRTRYSGNAPHPTAQDNGEVHGGIQDFRFKLRYNAWNGPITVTPFVAANVPSHGYEYFAHSAMGTRVRELEVGAYVGRILAPRLRNTFVQARYSYSFAERIAGIHHDRSSLDFEIGHFITPSIRVFALTAGQKTHGGVDVPDIGWRGMPPELARHHDRIARIDMLDAGAGIQVTVNRSLEVFGSFVRTLGGRNSHALSRAVTIGASWSFGGRLGLFDSTGAGDETMAKCLCQK
jgi:hypothetical protein